jgi:hypothetical protein
MTINIIQTITNILDENRQLINTAVTEAYVLYPAAGKAIKNIINDRIYTSSVNIGSKGNLKNYIEIDL